MDVTAAVVVVVLIVIVVAVLSGRTRGRHPGNGQNR